MNNDKQPKIRRAPKLKRAVLDLENQPPSENEGDFLDAPVTSLSWKKAYGDEFKAAALQRVRTTMKHPKDNEGFAQLLCDLRARNWALAVYQSETGTGDHWKAVTESLLRHDLDYYVKCIAEEKQPGARRSPTPWPNWPTRSRRKSPSPNAPSSTRR